MELVEQEAIVVKRAVIYVRVSSEKQAEKASPETQEADCRAHCERQGYTVVGVYRDIEKYRVGGKVVEPSGTRSDRPRFLRMLQDADAGYFDVLVAWREDRLYRGVTSAVIALKERVKAGIFNIEIVNGGFNLQTMEVLAWAAGVENEARVERRRMGMARRLGEGRIALSVPVYGYNVENGAFAINDEEAHWVKQIWQWHAEGISFIQIRKRLIALGAAQSQHKNWRRKHTWSMQVINGILNRDDYHTGIFITRLNGQVYEAEIPTLIDDATFEASRERRARWKKYPAGNFRTQALAAGLIYCEACGTTMGVTSRRSSSKPTAKRYGYYTCRTYSQHLDIPGCARNVSQPKVDNEMWERIENWLKKPEIFEQEVKQKAAELQATEVDAGVEIAKLEAQLAETLLERQHVIAFARKGIITEDDLEAQLLSIAMQTRIIRESLAEKQLLTGNRADHLLEAARQFRLYVQTGIEVLSQPVENEKDAARQFEMRRELVQRMFKRVIVRANKTIAIEPNFENLRITI